MILIFNLKLKTDDMTHDVGRQIVFLKNENGISEKYKFYFWKITIVFLKNENCICGHQPGACRAPQVARGPKGPGGPKGSPALRRS